MEECTKEELILYIDKLKKKLTRYESRFSALVDAYKNLNEEKQVLEMTLNTMFSKPKTVKAISGKSFRTGISNDPLGATSFDNSFASDVKQEVDDVLESVETEVCDDLVKSLEEKISALSSALQSVTESKKKAENAFQADKKALMLEYKTQLEKYEEEKKKAMTLEKDLKLKVRQEQRERESEVILHASMLKELQELLATERLEKDELRSQLNEKRKISSAVDSQKFKEYDSAISELKEELQLAKIDLVRARNEKQKPDGVIKNLTDEVEKIKFEHNSHLAKEQSRANYAEEILKSKQHQEEERIAELETRLTELSEMVGNYEKQRQEDQLVIRKLHERLENLDTENSALTTNRQHYTDNDNKITELQDQVGKLKSILKMTWKKADKSIDMIVSNSEIDEILRTDLAHLSCQADYKQLKDEFETYKRQHQKHSSDGAKDDKCSDDTTDYKRKIEKLELEVKYLEQHYEEKEKVNLAVVSNLQVDITCTKEHFENQIASLNEEHKLTIDRIEGELYKQRSRTVELLSEKDFEIERLQKVIYDREDDDKRLRHQRSLSERSFAKLDGDSSIVDEILVHSPTTAPGGGLFHYSEQISHYEAELSMCRSQVIDLESDVRDAEHREQQVLDQMQALKEEIRKLERGRSRESANLEYLKNICLQYMLTDSLSVKKQMSLALSTILSFSPAELKQLEKQQNGGWW